MLMSRRAPPSWGEQIRVAVWPRRAWSRSWRYAVLRLRRVKSLPRSLALGAAAGVFVAILPIPGVQVLSAAGLAWLIRGHRGAAALATFAANPITYPLIWIASYAIGATILGTPLSNAAHDLDSIGGLMSQTWSGAGAETETIVHGIRAILPAFATLTVGALPLATVSALAAYLGVRHLLRQRDACGATTRRKGLVVPAWYTLKSAAHRALSDVLWSAVAGSRWIVISTPYHLPYWHSGHEG